MPVLETAPIIRPLTTEAALSVGTGVEASRGVPDKMVVIAGAALTAVGLGMGSAFMGVSFAKASGRDAALKVQPCAYDSHFCSHDVADAESSRTTFGNASAWSFIAAGVFGAATVAYVLVPRSSKNSNGTKAAISAGPGGVGMTFASSW